MGALHALSRPPQEPVLRWSIFHYDGERKVHDESIVGTEFIANNHFQQWQVEDMETEYGYEPHKDQEGVRCPR